MVSSLTIHGSVLCALSKASDLRAHGVHDEPVLTQTKRLGLAFSFVILCSHKLSDAGVEMLLGTL